MTKLKITPESLPLGTTNWEEDGKRVGKLRHLKKLIFSRLKESSPPGSGVTKEGIESFSRGLYSAQNRSIQKVIFRECGFFDGGIFTALVPFLENSLDNNFNYLEMDDCDFAPRGAPLRDFLRMFTRAVGNLNSLKIFKVTHSNTGCGCKCSPPEQVIKSLSGRLGLKKLIIWGGGQIGHEEHIAFLLSKTNDLVVLDLYSNCIDDEGAAILVSELAGKKKVKDLDPWSSSGEWRTISAALRSPRFRLSRLSFLMGHCNNGRGESLLPGCRSLGLRRNAKLPFGWQTQDLLNYLQSPMCILEDLDLSGNSFNDNTAIPLFNALTNNRTLKCLNLSGSLRQATNATWQAISTLLESPKSVLENLNLCYSPVNSDALHSFSLALANNNSVTELLLYHDPDWNSRWGGFSRLLYNTNSIDDTFRSNHTLEKVVNSKKQPKDIANYLELNKGKSKFDVARQKIINVHFCGDIDMQPFIEMEMGALPNVIAWMAGGGFSFFYQFVRNMPLLFDFSGCGIESENGRNNLKRQRIETAANEHGGCTNQIIKGGARLNLEESLKNCSGSDDDDGATRPYVKRDLDIMDDAGDSDGL